MFWSRDSNTCGPLHCGHACLNMFFTGDPINQEFPEEQVSRNRCSSRVLGRTCFVVSRTKCLVHQYLLALKTDHPGLVLAIQMIWMVHQTSMTRSENDTPLVSMVKDTDGPTVWSDGPQN